MSQIYIKNPAEIEKMYAANQIVANIFEEMSTFIRPGISTADIDQVVRKIIKDHGATPNFLNYGDPPFPGAACVSVNQEVVHGIPDAEHYLSEGDIVSVDVGCTLDGWMADACRTYPVGEISEEAKCLLRVAEEAFWLGLAQAKVGNRIGDISHAVQQHCEAHGFGVIRELTGHGLGRSLHEGPSLNNYGKPGRGVRLVEGMTMCLEPMITAGSYRIFVAEDEWTIVTVDNSLSTHYENAFAITAEGPKVLSLTEEEARLHPEFAYRLN